MPVEWAGAESERVLADALRKAGWRVLRQPAAGDLRVGLLAETGGRKYAFEVKWASESRSDRLIPLLSQAILQARAIAQRLPPSAIPVAVVASRRIPESVVDHLKQFAEHHAPDVGIGVIDAQGLRSFIHHGLERLDSRPSYRMVRLPASPKRFSNLFSDLNQWMLKILLGQRLPKSLLSVPREPIRNAAQLARLACVSVMSASRLVNQLADKGFLDKRAERLEIVRVDELLEQWVSANRPMSADVPVRWILRKEKQQFFASVLQYAGASNLASGSNSRTAGRADKLRPRCCIGLFAAADALGLGFVHGVPPHLYMEDLNPDVLQGLGLSIEDPGRHVDAYVRIPSNKQAIFRPVVMREGLPVSDVLQIWLDVSAHPARGQEQANEIRRRVLMPLVGRSL